VLHSGARKHVLVLEASRARNELAASSTSDDGVASAVAALPFAERLKTDGLINTDSSNGQAELDFAQVPLHCIPSPENACFADLTVLTDAAVSALSSVDGTNLLNFRFAGCLLLANV